MRFPRFYIQQFSFSQKKAAITEKAVIHQILNILRLKKGERFIVFNGKGEESIVAMVGVKNATVVVEVQGIQRDQGQTDKRIVLYAALLKKDNFEWAVQKATEIGVAAIVPLVTARTVKMKFNRERIEKIIKEAAEQSGRVSLPVIANPTLFANALGDIQCPKNVLFDFSGSPFSLNQAKELGKHIGVWIGPEGGWDPQEIEAAKKHSFHIFSLGRLTLRAETAVAIGCYLAFNSC